MRNVLRFVLATAVATSLGIARGDVDFEYQPGGCTGQADAAAQAAAKPAERASRGERGEEQGSASGEPERVEDPWLWSGSGT